MKRSAPSVSEVEAVSPASADIVSVDDRPIRVHAAGALCWRTVSGDLQVLLIHRPRYDDWSWPKGKQDPGETLPQTAVREVSEEVGLKVTLGIPLPTVTYDVSAGRKAVNYWAAQVSKNTQPNPDGKEVDRMQWCSPERAASLLTNRVDVEPLRALAAAHDKGELATREVLIIRHAKAKPRSSWTQAEGKRPLAATGRRQACHLSRLLEAWVPQKIITSPWTRCTETISPFVKRHGTKVKTESKLTEASYRRKPRKAAEVVESLFDSSKRVALCTHRPVLPTVVDVLAQHSSPEVAANLPEKDPWLSPCEVIVAHVSTKKRMRILSTERHRPFDD